MACRGYSGLGVGIASPPSSLAVWTVDLHHPHASLMQVTGEPRPVAAGALHADELDWPAAFEPAQQCPVPGGRGVKAFDT
jgi:hypothetical protein